MTLLLMDERLARPGVAAEDAVAPAGDGEAVDRPA
jgi:hypothetical protein